MNSYRRLISNTFLFSVSTFGSKILVFFLTPFYTSILSETEYGITDLLIQTGNFLIPLVSMGVFNAVLRFGLDEKADKACIFTTGLLVVVVGEGILALFYPLLQNIGLMADYMVFLLLYIFMANMHSLCDSMAQALGRIRLCAVSGILCTALVVGLNILLLSVFRLGITGYILSNVIADGLSALLLFFALKLWRYFRPAALKRSLIKSMFRYCLPLIPATICSWIINISDRYFISYMIGSDISGLYAIANKISMILLVASGIFTSAWQLSIVSSRSKPAQERFFSNVFSVYEAGALIGASVLMAASRLIMRFLAAPDYYKAWHYAPVLILGTAVACLGSFFSSVYMAEKHSTATLVTTVAGAVTNIVGNALLIPVWGAIGAAVATFFSYLVIFIARAIHSQKLLRIQWGVLRFFISMAILLIQCYLVEKEQVIPSLVCCICVGLLHFRPLLKAMNSGVFTVLLSKKRRM